MTHQSDLTEYAASFVTGLYEAGIRKVVISPGSRSTPLAMMFHHQPKIETWVDVDERSAGFFALGMAKGLQEPVALLCSSGTASANYFPAIIEARYARIPLIVLTADRPHELREVGAPQAIDQIKLYGDHVKWHQDMPIPDEKAETRLFVKASATRAVSKAIEAPQGPVHLNFPFREPLVPDVSRGDLWKPISKVGEQILLGQTNLLESFYDKLAKKWSSVEKPLIVVGPLQDMGLAPKIITLARSLQAPIIADPLSGLRTGAFEKDLVIDSYDAFLRSAEIADELKADGVIRFGAMPVSKPFLKYLEKAKPKHYLIVDESGVWRDPTNLATQMIKADSGLFCGGLLEAMRRLGMAFSSDWLAEWQKVNLSAAEIVSNFVKKCPWFEGHIASCLIKHTDDGAAIFVGNSMPIRDMDTFLLKGNHAISVYANRGANGIDGVVSTALGLSTIKKPLTLLIGDLSFFHDSNGLMMAKIYNIDVTVVVINNNGGGIFSFLSQAKENEETFEALFGTPLDIDVEAVSKVYGATYRKAVDKRAFEEALSELKEQPGLKIIEAVTSRKENTAIHRQLWDEVISANEVILNDH